MKLVTIRNKRLRDLFLKVGIINLRIWVYKEFTYYGADEGIRAKI